MVIRSRFPHFPKRPSSSMFPGLCEAGASAGTPSHFLCTYLSPPRLTFSHPYNHLLLILRKVKKREGFPSGAVVKNLPANAGDTGSSPGPGRSHMPRSN